MNIDLGKFSSLMNAATDSILCECALRLRSVFPITSAMVPMMAEKTNPPMIMPKMAMTRSTLVTALMSPYPTVVIVVNAQYMLAMYRSTTSFAVGSASSKYSRSQGVRVPSAICAFSSLVRQSSTEK